MRTCKECERQCERQTLTQNTQCHSLIGKLCTFDVCEWSNSSIIESDLLNKLQLKRKHVHRAVQKKVLSRIVLFMPVYGAGAGSIVKPVLSEAVLRENSEGQREKRERKGKVK